MNHPQMLDRNFIAKLAGVVGDRHLWGADVLSAREPGCDPGNLAAGLLVAPRNSKEVSAVLAICNEIAVGVVPHGGLTGLSGGAVSEPGQLIISTTRVNQEIEVDPDGQTIVVDAGVALEDAEKAAGDFGLSLGIDIAARGTANIGGMLATNAGGSEAFRYGVMRHRVLGLEAILPDGTIFSDMKRVPKANEGLDLKQLFVGSEGTLGIITRAVLKLEARKGLPATALVAVPSAAAALAVFRALRRSPVVELSNAEIMWHRFASVSARDLGLPSLLEFADRPVYVIFEICPRLITANGSDLLADALADAGIEEAVIAKSDSEREAIWRIREDTWTIDRQYPHGHWYDVSVPTRLLDDYVASVQERVNAVGADLMVSPWVISATATCTSPFRRAGLQMISNRQSHPRSTRA